MSVKVVKCPICGTEFEGSAFDDCPYCDWEYEGLNYTGQEDEPNETNPVTYNQAKELVAKGLNIWGEPLPKRDK